MSIVASMSSPISLTNSIKILFLTTSLINTLTLLPSCKFSVPSKTKFPLTRISNGVIVHSSSFLLTVPTKPSLSLSTTSTTTPLYLSCSLSSAKYLTFTLSPFMAVDLLCMGIKIDLSSKSMNANPLSAILISPVPIFKSSGMKNSLYLLTNNFPFLSKSNSKVLNCWLNFGGILKFWAILIKFLDPPCLIKSIAEFSSMFIFMSLSLLLLLLKVKIILN